MGRANLARLSSRAPRLAPPRFFPEISCIYKNKRRTPPTSNNRAQTDLIEVLAEKEMTLASSKNTRKRAEASFKKDGLARKGAQAMPEYEAEGPRPSRENRSVKGSPVGRGSP